VRYVVVLLVLSLAMHVRAIIIIIIIIHDDGIELQDAELVLGQPSDTGIPTDVIIASLPVHDFDQDVPSDDEDAKYVLVYCSIVC